MSPSRPASLDAALKRLSGALDQLETATARVRQRRAMLQNGEAGSMEDERQRLSHALETALQRSTMLEQATDDVARRLSRAGGTLRRLLASGEADR